MILTIKTDNPEAEIAIYDGDKKVDGQKWQAHRELSDTILKKIDELLERNKRTTKDLSGLVVFKGPGSFTGLRIGLSVANSMAYGLDVPIVSAQEKDWAASGIDRLMGGENEKIAMPEYGSEANITKPKK